MLLSQCNVICGAFCCCVISAFLISEKGLQIGRRRTNTVRKELDFGIGAECRQAPAALHEFKSLGSDEIHFQIRKGLVDVLTSEIS